jgi:diacylglycerol diphosphate phosphatase / phosphatidate phosphatase
MLTMETAQAWLKPQPYSIEKRPSFHQWLKLSAIDIVTFLILAGVGAAIATRPPMAMHIFPLDELHTQISYPYQEQTVPHWLDAILACGIPIMVSLLAQLRVRSFWDANNAILGLIYATLISSVFQVTIKWLIGGFRPHFLDVCQPDTSRVAGTGYGRIFYTQDVCTGSDDLVNNALFGFPSGHATTICAGMLYTSVYLNAKLKLASNRYSPAWKLIVVMLPLLGAILVCGSLILDRSHN